MRWLLSLSIILATLSAAAQAADIAISMARNQFGYTQTSFWDIESNSAPFEDTSYKPELFWTSRNLISGVSAVKGLFFQSGFQHESNGRGGDLSRNTNYLYVKPVFVFFSGRNRYGLQIAPKIWTYINNDDDTNPDLADYRGYFDLEIKLGKADSFVLKYVSRVNALLS